MTTIADKIKEFMIPSKPWEIRKCLFTYPEGYAVFNYHTNTILDTGLTKQKAQNICDELNSEKP